MSNRTYCPNCLRAQTACICHCVKPVKASIQIGILQHLSEVTQSKGSARLTAMCLANTKFWVGDELASAEPVGLHASCIDSDLSPESSLMEWLLSQPTYLLYPEIEGIEKVEVLPAGKVFEKHLEGKFQVLVLDGTWRKTHKMLMQNPALQSLPRISITPIFESQYQIRKQKNRGSLATIEAIAQLLRELEPNNSSIENLDKSFLAMQEFLLSLRKNSKPRG